MKPRRTRSTSRLDKYLRKKGDIEPDQELDWHAQKEKERILRKAAEPQPTELQEMVRTIRERDVEAPVIASFLRHLASLPDAKKYKPVFRFVLKSELYKPEREWEARKAAEECLKKIEEKEKAEKKKNI